MRDYANELKLRAAFIKSLLASTGASGVVLGLSGGKDSVLAGILCRQATDNVIGVIMPCGSQRNYGSDRADALEFAALYGIKAVEADLTPARDALAAQIQKSVPISGANLANLAPRLRMATLYAFAAETGCLVAGTGNRSEIHMGYFTKWGDGAHDFNPISDLTASEVYEFLRYLKVPSHLAEKPPSAGLYDGQTDEQDMGVSYEELDGFLLTGKRGGNYDKIERAHNSTAHKRSPIVRYNP